mmetsp:Transcript_44555/g.117744  ORF Transcript_44555/g.117744 Transcript_44555/m.117744 type:complete len:375 (-) Transcript_44555:1282-2406(-)
MVSRAAFVLAQLAPPSWRRGCLIGYLEPALREGRQDVSACLSLPAGMAAWRPGGLAAWLPGCLAALAALAALLPSESLSAQPKGTARGNTGGLWTRPNRRAGLGCLGCPAAYREPSARKGHGAAVFGFSAAARALSAQLGPFVAPGCSSAAPLSGPSPEASLASAEVAAGADAAASPSSPFLTLACHLEAGCPLASALTLSAQDDRVLAGQAPSSPSHVPSPFHSSSAFAAVPFSTHCGPLPYQEEAGQAALLPPLPRGWRAFQRALAAQEPSSAHSPQPSPFSPPSSHSPSFSSPCPSFSSPFSLSSPLPSPLPLSSPLPPPFGLRRSPLPLPSPPSRTLEAKDIIGVGRGAQSLYGLCRKSERSPFSFSSLA